MSDCQHVLEITTHLCPIIQFFCVCFIYSLIYFNWIYTALFHFYITIQFEHWAKPCSSSSLLCNHLEKCFTCQQSVWSVSLTMTGVWLHSSGARVHTLRLTDVPILYLRDFVCLFSPVWPISNNEKSMWWTFLTVSGFQRKAYQETMEMSQLVAVSEE